MDRPKETKIKTLHISFPKYPQKGEAKWEIEIIEGGNEVHLLHDELADHTDKLLDNRPCSYGGDLWKIIQCYQTGANCGPWLTNFYLECSELKFYTVS